MKISRLMMVLGALTALNLQAADQKPSLKLAQQLADSSLIVDTHIDVPYRIHGAWEDVTKATAGGDFDYPRAKSGGLNVPFMSIYIPPEKETSGGGFQLANELIDSVEAMVARAPERFMMVKSVAQAKASMQQGKIGLALGMENGTPIEGNLENLEHFADRGIRYITLAHSQANHISDSSYDPERPNGGLSDFGKELVAAMNRTGVMIDTSHISDEAFWQVMELSKAPVIASHSSTRHFTPGFERNISDEMIVALAKNGGVVQINFGSSFVTAQANAYMIELMGARASFLEQHGVTADSPEAKAFIKDFQSQHPLPFATLSEVADHFDHVISLVGVDHVGIGSDYDGVGDSLPVGLKDVASYPALVNEFLKRDYSPQQIKKILGGNLIRVWSEVEQYAASHTAD